MSGRPVPMLVRWLALGNFTETKAEHWETIGAIEADHTGRADARTEVEADPRFADLLSYELQVLVEAEDKEPWV